MMETVQVKSNGGKAVRNNGTRRVILGPPPLSERKGQASDGLVLGSLPDQAEIVPVDQRQANVAEFPAAVVKLPAFRAVAQIAQLQVA